MEDKYWWKDIVIYETYVDKFARDFKGLTEKLGYLEDLGINCIHLLPFFPSPRVDDGYDVSDYTNVQSELGTIEDAKSFISQASKHGIRVMIDLVFNHTSTQHPWFKEASSSPDSLKREYYLWSKTGEEYPEAYNPFEHLKPKSWILDPTSGQYYFSTFYPEQADLNWDNPEVEREFLNIMDFWVDAGVSLFRLDAASFLIKRDGTNCRHLPETHTVLKRIRRHIEENYPHVALLAEVHAPIEKAIEYFG
ncbi:MAG: alpha-amylase family glycosyl hydrolase, partial [Candidatus Paceibacterota bacterium]